MPSPENQRGDTFLWMSLEETKILVIVTFQGLSYGSFSLAELLLGHEEFFLPTAGVV